MGIWGNIKGAFRPAAITPPAQADPQPDPHADSQRAEALARYAQTKAAAAAAGQTVKGYRAGYINAAETKTALENLNPDNLQLKIMASPNGLDLTLDDGRLIDHKTLALRRWSIFGFRVAGMSYYEDPEKPFRFRLGQSVGLKREPDNEFDANAVAITLGKSRQKVGYVNKQRAKWIAALLDDGHELTGIIIQAHPGSSPRVLIAPTETMAALTRGLAAKSA